VTATVSGYFQWSICVFAKKKTCFERLAGVWLRCGVSKSFAFLNALSAAASEGKMRDNLCQSSERIGNSCTPLTW